ncbi:hypothetical protein Tsubulata_038993, partial [Turnera subulata]
TLTLITLLNRRKSRVDSKKRPPGPPGWPVFGNMFDLGTLPHKTMSKLKAKYGPLLWLRLGYQNTLVIQSSKAAEELFKNHDSSFSDRAVPWVLTAHNYSSGSLVFRRYGPKWRTLRRLCSTEFMVTRRINDTVLLRRKCIDDMIRCIVKDVAAAQAKGESGEVNVGHYLFVMLFNLMGNLTLSQDLLNTQSRDGYEFFGAMDGIIKWVGRPNVADFLPILKWLDPQGLKKNMVKDLGRAMSIVEKFMRDRVAQKSDASKDFLSTLLEYEGDGKEGSHKLSDHDILVIVLRTWSILPVWSSLVISLTLITLITLLNRRKSRVGSKKRPPGPPGWPVFGNMFDLGTLPHQTMNKLKAKYGPLLWLRLGYQNTLVIQSSRAAEELFKNHDSSFSDRAVPWVLTAHNYCSGSLVFGRYGPEWRMVRRLCSTEFMVNKRINDTLLLRRKCIDDMIGYIVKDVAAAQAKGESGEVNVGHYLFVMLFNLMGNLTLSQDLLNSQSRDGYEFFDSMDGVLKGVGRPNVADFLPMLKWLDPQGLKKNMVKDLGRAMRIIEKFMRVRVAQKSDTSKDLLNTLLEYEGDGKEGSHKRKSRVGSKKRPPGPPGWPVFGNMFDLGTLPHKTMNKLKAKYGPLLWLRLGYQNTLVIQSSRAAVELFKNHDSSFSDRAVPWVLTAHNYSSGSPVFSRYGPEWRMLRRLCSAEFMVNKRINDTVLLRRKCIDDMIGYIMKDVAAAQAKGESGEVNVSYYLFVILFNMMGNLTLSQDLLNSQSRDGYEFFDAMDGVLKGIGAPNVADFLPILKWLDPQGHRKNMVTDLGRAMRIVEKFMRDRVAQESDTSKDFLSTLLEYEGDGKEGSHKLSDHDILIIV